MRAGDSDSAIAFELLVQPTTDLAHLKDCSDSTQGVVLVDRRDPEDRHQRVAHERFNDAAMAHDDRLHLVEVAVHQLNHRLGVELLS